MRAFFVAAAALVVLLVLCLIAPSADAGFVCRSKDCSDVVGDFLVKDNRLSSRVITHREHLDHMEQSRIRRIDILRRERPSL